ncbi:MAG: SH3 domain-containing protein [Pseudomonadota bacterium]
MLSKLKSQSLGLAAALALTGISITALAQQPQVPVLAGGEADYDACGSQGVVQGLDPNGDGFLAVRSGPSSNYGMLDKVYNGAIVNLCDERGNWLGVVYSHESVDCGVGTPWPRRQAYTGPCRSGWVFRKFVAGYAG